MQRCDPAGSEPTAEAKEPSIGIVIPAYNAAEFLATTIQSVTEQSYQNWRCYVVDDGSQDHTALIIDQAPDSRIRLIRQPNAGVSAARNRGLRSAQEDYILFLDADDILHRTALERLSAVLSRDGAAVAAFGTLRKILADGTPYPGQPPLRRSTYPAGDVLKPMLEHNFLANGGQVLLRTAVAERIGGFNTALRLSEDWEFWCRLAAEGDFLLIDRVPEVFSLRMSESSVTRSAASVWSNYAPSFYAVFENEAFQNRLRPAEWRRIKRKAWAAQRWEFGRVSFTQRSFAAAFRAMGESLVVQPHLKRFVLLGLAVLSFASGRSLASRLRFADEDARRKEENAG